MRKSWIVVLWVLAACARSSPPLSASPPAAVATTTTGAASARTATRAAAAEDEVYGPRELKRDAAALRAVVETPLGRSFIAEAPSLPAIQPRVVWRSTDKKRWYRDRTSAAAPDAGSLVEVRIDETTFYAARYGSPLAYARAMDVLGGPGGVTDFAGKTVLDIGCGGVASLRLMAAMGARVVGYDVDASLPVIFGEPGDQGPVVGSGGRAGSYRLGIGPTPFEPRMEEAPFDVIVAKNTLKRGYVRPDRPADPRFLVHLGVEDVDYLAGLYELLEPGGTLLIYNISPPQAPPDQPYLPWADGRSPWTPGEWEAAGFDVLAFDVIDDAPMHTMGRALGWPADSAYFAHYTLVRRRPAPPVDR